MDASAVAFASLTLLIALLWLERSLLRWIRRRIPVCIVVLGTRGKSSVVRLIAHGLREDGYRVLYKTTGSQSIVGQVDGTEAIIRRRTLPTPLEQRRVLRDAARQQADVAVIEAMSIRPESLRAEVSRILDPDVVVVTSIGSDHVADISDPPAAFANAVPQAALAIVSAVAPGALTRRFAVRSVRVQKVVVSEADAVPISAAYEEWGENVALATSACVAIGAPEDVVRRGMASVVPDVGALTAWRLSVGGARWIAVNAFAANDPDSTRRVLRRAIDRWRDAGSPVIGILNLRRDRGDRTLQWARTLLRDAWPFDRLLLIGHAPWGVRRRILRTLGSQVVFSPAHDPTAAVVDATAGCPHGGLLFGFGNIGGSGLELVRAWATEGEAL